MGTGKRSVRFASLLTCAAWAVALAGFFEYEPAGFHTIQDSMAIVFSESDADRDSDRDVLSGSDTMDNPADAVMSFPVGSAIPSLPLPSLLRSGIGRLPTAVDRRIATTVLRP